MSVGLRTFTDVDGDLGARGAGAEHGVPAIEAGGVRRTAERPLVESSHKLRVALPSEPALVFGCANHGSPMKS